MLNEQLYDIYGSWHVPFWQTRLFIFSCSSIVGILVLASIFFLIKKYTKKKRISAQQEALRALEILKKKPIQTRQDAQDAYFMLTTILKRFFQSHYALPFEAMSDTQMITTLQSTSFPAHSLGALQDLIQARLEVKYAQQTALQADLMRDIAWCSDTIITLAQAIPNQK